MTDDKYVEARERMVREQLEGRGIASPRVLEAMRVIPRHAFVPKALRGEAYGDRALPVGHDQTISQPYIVAVMTQLLTLAPGDRVLEIGTGSGYQCAVLAHLTMGVVTIERHETLSLRARSVLEALEISNVTYAVGDGSLGWGASAPYDAIIVTAAAPRIPQALTKQLKMGGRLVVPVGSRDEQMLYRVRRTAAGFEEERGIGCRFVPLLGREGWQHDE